MTVRAVDANWNLVGTRSDIVGLSTTDTSAALPTNAALAAGTVTFQVSLNRAGAWAITATDISEPTKDSSTSPAITVERAGTSTAIASSPGVSRFGQPVMLTATVSAASPGTLIPTGTATFREAATVLGTATLSSGRATLSTAALSVGSHAITAEYGGDAAHSGGTSFAITQTVNKAATTTEVRVSPEPSALSRPAIMTAVVSAVVPGAGTPTGTVRFKDGSALLGTGLLAGGSAAYSVSTLSVGSHAFTAEYAGDDNFEPSVSPEVMHGVTAAADLSVTATVLSRPR